MENKIETVVEETEAMDVATHAGFKKGAVILGVAGVVGVVGLIATKFIIKPVIKKIKARKNSKKKAEFPVSTDGGSLDTDVDDESLAHIFDEEE